MSCCFCPEPLRVLEVAKMLDEVKAFADTCAKLLPRVEVVSEKEAGVAWVRGRSRVVKPGTLFIYWPVWTEVEWLPLRPDPVEIQAQTIMLRDAQGRYRYSYVVTGTVQWRIKNILLACNKCEDVENRLATEAQKAIRNALWGCTLAQISKDESKIEEEITAATRSGMRGFGVHVEEVFLATFSEACCSVHYGSVEI